MNHENIISQIDTLKQRQVAIAQDIEQAEEAVWVAHGVLDEAKIKLKALRAEAKAAKSAMLKMLEDYADCNEVAK